MIVGRVVVASYVGGRLGVAETVITGGGFELTIPSTIEYSSYTQIAMYVDEDTDDTCDVGEPLWGFVTGSVQENVLLEVTPDDRCLSGGGPNVGAGCRPWSTLAGPCEINGQAALDMRLPCPL